MLMMLWIVTFRYEIAGSYLWLTIN